MQSLKYNTPLVKTIVLNRYLGDEQVFGGLHERLEFLTFSLLIFCHSTFCKEKKEVRNKHVNICIGIQLIDPKYRMPYSIISIILSGNINNLFCKNPKPVQWTVKKILCKIYDSW